MTEKERFDLCMSTKLGEILTEEFKTYLLANVLWTHHADMLASHVAGI